MEIQEIGLKYKKKLLFLALRVVKIRTGCPARLYSKHNWKRYWVTCSSWPCSDLQGRSSCSPDVPLEASSKNLKIFVILWYLRLPYSNICSQISPFNAIFLSSSFKADLPWLTASFLSSSCIFFMPKTLPDWLLSPTPPALHFRIIPAGLKLLFQGASFLDWPEISYQLLDKKKKQKQQRDLEGAAQLKFSRREEFLYVPVKGIYVFSDAVTHTHSQYLEKTLLLFLLIHPLVFSFLWYLYHSNMFMLLLF